ncbi:thymidylate synthase [Magnetospirillum sulfuroxidans]|uniref:thymidylate synthase n=1 Tax=Magnetospirillum sulfuroxidans TaxID=611300 RepID=A0ABS5IHU4_9PROT|nr:thymidylate synthase [Magnetospirillum sulfuroxidans]MBR9973782.1 thymidylate synthase [Magnetospirillum sulfuroxidans]
MHCFQGQSADELWQNLHAKFSVPGEAKTQEGRNGETVEFLHAHMAITDPRQRWVTSKRPANNPAFIIASTFWILGGMNEAAFLNSWFRDLPKYQGDGSIYHGAYGHRIREWFGIDQLDRAYRALSKNPNSRQVVIQIWSPELDLPDEDGDPADADIPCNLCCLPKVRSGKLEWLQVMRSHDLAKAIPKNFAQFTMVQEVLAGWLGVDLGEYHHISDSLHIYDEDFPSLQFVEGAPPPLNEDDLRLPKSESDRVLGEALAILRELADPALSREAFGHLMSTASLPPAYHNLVAIAAAYIARRSRWDDEMGMTLAGCTNPLLTAIWNNWALRFPRRSR